jgi:hypothetical protein
MSKWNGELKLRKVVNNGGEHSLATCAQQLFYKIINPIAYITPNVVKFYKVWCTYSQNIPLDQNIYTNLCKGSFMMKIQVTCI